MIILGIHICSIIVIKLLLHQVLRIELIRIDLFELFFVGFAFLKLHEVVHAVFVSLIESGIVSWVRAIHNFNVLNKLKY